MQNTFFFQKKVTLKINAPNSFFENESNFFYIILDFQQVFENLKLNKLVKEERRLDLEDWSLDKRSFEAALFLKNEFESLYFWKVNFQFFGGW